MLVKSTPTTQTIHTLGLTLWLCDPKSLSQGSPGCHQVPKEDDLKKLAILGWCIEWLQAETAPGCKKGTCFKRFQTLLGCVGLAHSNALHILDSGGGRSCVALRRMWQAVDTSVTFLQMGSADIPQSQKIKMGWGCIYRHVGLRLSDYPSSHQFFKLVFFSMKYRKWNELDITIYQYLPHVLCAYYIHIHYACIRHILDIHLTYTFDIPCTYIIIHAF